MAVPMWMQEQMRDSMFEFAMTQGYKILQEIQKEYPEEVKQIIRQGTKKGSNQYEYRGKVKLEIADEAFDKIERGSEYAPFQGKYTQNVKRHKRETDKPKTRTRKIARAIMRRKPKTTSVKAHKRTYTNMKPVKLSTGEWRILKGMPATKGKAPLDKAVNKVINNEFQIAKWITQFFK